MMPACMYTKRITSSLLMSCLWVTLWSAGLAGYGFAEQDLAERGLAESWQTLFNGRDLDGWVGDSEVWTVEEGAITGQTNAAKPLKHNTFLVWTAGQVDDFELRLEYRFQSDHGNSGIQYRSHLDNPKQHIVGGYQADMETGSTYTGILYEERGRGILAQRGQRVTLDQKGQRTTEKFAETKELQKFLRQKDWNQYTIIAEGPRLRHIINGQLMSETIDHQQDKRATSGILALQAHQGPPMKVQFRNLKLRRIAPAAEKTSLLKKKLTTAKANWQSESAAIPAENLTIAPGFQVELLYSVPREEQGSWVSMTVDPQGRLIVSDQGKAGLFRITPPALGADPKQTKIEKIQLPIGMAHGMTCAFDSLYVVVNGKDVVEEGPGLYRVRDTTGDDQYDTCELIQSIEGRGEHGPHAIIPSPDGKTLTLVGGNHTPLPPIDNSAAARVWGEDLLLKRIWDVNGHAVGVKAPAGWICRLDPEGKSWELISNGYRNTYDIAYNQAGDLFAFDADMEWDIGLPWYRPTRVCHATSGSEFGWRSGSGKWPSGYPDSLPAVLDIGNGSPTGVTFGYKAQFPSRYQQALYICDWSFGKLYAVHLQPDGATYKAEREDFITGAPLPLTDIVINPQDGAMYFTIGGRGTQSGLYRVTYQGTETQQEPTATSTVSSKPHPYNQLRHELETWHGKQDPAAIDAAWPHLAHVDRHVRFAARTAIENQPVEHWVRRALDETRPSALIEAMVALARCTGLSEVDISEAGITKTDKHEQSPQKPTAGPTELAKQMIDSLGNLTWQDLSESQQLALLRAYGLIWTRLDPSDAKLNQIVAARLDSHFPSAGSARLNRELSRILARLDIIYSNGSILSATAGWTGQGRIARTIKLLESAPTQEEQIHYAYVLRSRIGDVPKKLQRRYFQWFEQTRTFHGGHSMRGFVQKIREQAIEGLNSQQQAALSDVLTLDLAQQKLSLEITDRPLVKEYQTQDIIHLMEHSPENRSFQQGRKLFGTALCFRCHRIGGEGGSTGPDLTHVGQRFNKRDLAEAIVEPSKVVSDQYRSTMFQMESGKTVVGRIANMGGDSIQIVTNMLTPGDMTKLRRKEIVSMESVDTSNMPSGLLNSFTEEEIADLLAYLLSGGKTH
ncbi:MAG: family 16 glycoside hydrolase [Pirellulales bacterium]